MSVFKKYRGKRVQRGDSNYALGRWYMWRRVGGIIVHRALPNVFSREEAQQAEIDMVRNIAKHCDEKMAVKIAEKIAKVQRYKEREYLYLIESGGHYKIGRTKNLSSRVKGIGKTIIPFETTLVCAVFVEAADQAEKTLHSEFAASRMKGEWFLFSSDQVDAVMQRMCELRRSGATVLQHQVLGATNGTAVTY
jgi:hypothetical protein